MIGLEERVAFLEGRAVEQSNVLAGVRDSMRSLERSVERLELRFDGLERRFDGLELRFDGLERRFDGFERSVSSRFDAMDAKMSRQFTWLSGMLLTGLLGMVGALIAR